MLSQQHCSAHSSTAARNKLSSIPTLCESSLSSCIGPWSDVAQTRKRAALLPPASARRHHTLQHLSRADLCLSRAYGRTPWPQAGRRRQVGSGAAGRSDGAPCKRSRPGGVPSAGGHTGGRGAQKNIFGNLAWPHATVQLDFKREDGAPVKTATVKAKGSETETLPLFTNKDDVRGEVRAALQKLPAPEGSAPRARSGRSAPGRGRRSRWPTCRARRWSTRASRCSCWARSSWRPSAATRTTLCRWVRAPCPGPWLGAGVSWPARGAEVRGAAVRDLAPAGELTSPQTYPFEFDNVEMQYDSYRGLQVRLRCALPGAPRSGGCCWTWWGCLEPRRRHCSNTYLCQPRCWAGLRGDRA